MKEYKIQNTKKKTTYKQRNFQYIRTNIMNRTNYISTSKLRSHSIASGVAFIKSSRSQA